MLIRMLIVLACLGVAGCSSFPQPTGPADNTTTPRNAPHAMALPEAVPS